VENHIWKTKKEKIIDYVHQDPFLKIGEIASKAETTSRYVRTILSEANISLMKLRKQYAIDIEKRNNKSGNLLFSYLLDVPFDDTKIKREDDIIINNPTDFKKLKANINENYFHHIYKHKIGTSNWCLNTFTLEKNCLKSFKKLESISEIDSPDVLDKEIQDLLETKEISATDIKIGVEVVTKQIGEILGLDTLSPVFKVKQKLLYKDRPVMLNLAYFHPGKINLSLSYKRGITINKISSFIS
jgi:AraC-like DNA-binding protein